MIRLRRSGLRTALITIMAALAAASCSGSAAPGPSANPSVTATSSGSTTGTGSGTGPTTVTTASAMVTVPLTGFGEITVTVTLADGTTRRFCLLLADTDKLRQQGLMLVEDPELGGHDGMLFVFPDDVDGGFWMRNTRLPLTIVYVAADGTPVTTTDMVPCPDSDERCPSYASAGPYRYAIEVPQGRMERLGLTEGARLSVGEKGCAAA